MKFVLNIFKWVIFWLLFIFFLGGTIQVLQSKEIELNSPTEKVIVPLSKPSLNFTYINHTLIKFHIKRNEGFKQTVYLDTRGNLTVGYGHKLPKKGKYQLGDTVSMDRINRWFQADYNTALSCAKRFLKNDYKSNELIVITDMAFNLGCTTLHDFWRLRKHINNRDYVMASKAIRGSTYYKQVKNRANRNIMLLNQ